MPARPRVLHLAYEDHLAPGSGGGSVRTLEINSRLAETFDIDQVFATYPGSAPRVVDGLRYRHLGPPRGSKFVRQLGYFAALPVAVRRASRGYDLVVEDFGAPFGSIGIPHVTPCPTVAVVQWLFADEKSAQYHLPFRRVEDFGVRSHSHFIAVSRGIADQVRSRNPKATVDVVANGLPDVPTLTERSTSARRDIVFLGRLEIEHKGLDLLLHAYAKASQHISQDLVIAGDGAGEARVRSDIDRLGLAGRVRLIGRIEAADRFDYLASADVVAMPSRYESFGMVAAEAASVGTPTLSFDIDCLRDLVPTDLRVPAFDVDAYAAKLVHVCTDDALRERHRRELPFTVADLSWDTLAERQGEVYRDVMSRPRPRAH